MLEVFLYLPSAASSQINNLVVAFAASKIGALIYGVARLLYYDCNTIVGRITPKVIIV
jgi:hypothetical protein